MRDCDLIELWLHIHSLFPIQSIWHQIRYHWAALELFEYWKRQVIPQIAHVYCILPKDPIIAQYKVKSSHYISPSNHHKLTSGIPCNEVQHSWSRTCTNCHPQQVPHEPSTIYTEYFIQRVQHELSATYTDSHVYWGPWTPSTVYTLNCIDKIENTTSTMYTECHIHRALHIPSTTYTKYCIEVVLHRGSTA